MDLTVATWNINSVRPRVVQVARFLKRHRPHVLCLQETKCADASFPVKAFHALGYAHIELNGQAGYHGVAVLSRLPLERLEARDFNGTGHARHLPVRVHAEGAAPVVLHNFYVPAGGDVPDARVNPKFGEKLAYLDEMARWFAGHARTGAARMILTGDLNVAPLETDVWSHRQLLKVVSHTPVEVEHLERLRKALGWVDVMRRHVPPEEPLFTWWSYRARDWRASNRGRRLDHLWATPDLAAAATAMRVVAETRDWDRPSDHVPVLATFAEPAPVRRSR